MTKECAKTGVASEAAVELLPVAAASCDGRPKQAGKCGSRESSGQNLEGVAWFMSDMRSGRLAWVKIVFFLQTAGLVTLYPYLAIHMRCVSVHTLRPHKNTRSETFELSQFKIRFHKSELKVKSNIELRLSLRRYLGFTVEDTAWVNSAVPVVDVVGPPIAGIVADKIGNFRVFMSAVTFLNGLASLLLLAVPTSEN